MWESIRVGLTVLAFLTVAQLIGGLIERALGIRVLDRKKVREEVKSLVREELLRTANMPVLIQGVRALRIADGASEIDGFRRR